MSNDPAKLGKFIIEAVLGKGAMGIVYKARDPFINRMVALKTIRKDLLGDLESGTNQKNLVITRFKREAQAAGLLSHPNIVSVFEYGAVQGTAFIAMEYVQGRSLKEIFARNERFEMDAIVKIMLQILGALAYSHKHGIVHRDIKPSNVMMMPDGQVKIMDFGIAHMESSDLTQMGVRLGTPNYMSPEQFMGQKVDGRSDLFSAGIIFYQFVTGENPFDGPSITTIMHRLLSQEPLDPFKLNFHVSTEQNQIIKQALSKRPEDRFQTAEAFSQAITEAFDAKPTGQKQQAPEPMDDSSEIIILSETISEKGENSSSAVPESEMENAIPRNSETLSSMPLQAKPNAFLNFPGFSSRLKWAVVCGIIAALVIGLILSIDRFMGTKNNAVPVVHDSHSTALKPLTISETSQVIHEEKQEEAGMAANALTVQPPPAVEIHETKTSAVVGSPSSEPAAKKPPEKKAHDKETVMVVVDPQTSPMATDVFVTPRGFKGKSGATPKDSSATISAKPKPPPCNDIYLKISLGGKLSAEEQRILSNCR
jgi:serine/threonine protein kinase